MLKLKYLFENYNLAKQCLAFYDYDEKSLDNMLSNFRISSNAIYPFCKKDDTQEVCFLRLSPSEEKLLSSVGAEIQLIQWLREKGFSAMKPVPMKTGELVKELHTEWGTFNVSCFAKVPGNSLEDTKGNLSVVRGYGQILGKLHSLLKAYPYAEKHRNHEDLLTEIGDRIKKYDAPEIVKEEYRAVCSEVEHLSISSTNYGVIHYDFEPDNVFYDEEENVFSVIDFDDAICCWYALDIVRALDALDDITGVDNIDDAAHAFLEGYQSVTDLTDEQKQSFSLMRRLIHLQEYATILYVLSEPVDEMPDWMDELIKKLKYKLCCLDKSMEIGSHYTIF